MSNSFGFFKRKNMQTKAVPNIKPIAANWRRFGFDLYSGVVAFENITIKFFSFDS